MSDAYLKVKDNGAQGLALVREETDTSVSELKSAINGGTHTNFTADKNIDSTTGAIVDASNVSVSEKIPYTWEGVTKYYCGDNTQTIYGVAFYDSSDTLIKYFRAPYSTGGDSYREVNADTQVTGNIAYVRFSFLKGFAGYVTNINGSITRWTAGEFSEEGLKNRVGDLESDVAELQTATLKSIQRDPFTPDISCESFDYSQETIHHDNFHRAVPDSNYLWKIGYNGYNSYKMNYSSPLANYDTTDDGFRLIHSKNDEEELHNILSFDEQYAINRAMRILDIVPNDPFLVELGFEPDESETHEYTSLAYNVIDQNNFNSLYFDYNKDDKTITVYFYDVIDGTVTSGQLSESSIPYTSYSIRLLFCNNRIHIWYDDVYAYTFDANLTNTKLAVYIPDTSYYTHWDFLNVHNITWKSLLNEGYVNDCFETVVIDEATGKKGNDAIKQVFQGTNFDYIYSRDSEITKFSPYSERFELRYIEGDRDGSRRTEALFLRKTITSEALSYSKLSKYIIEYDVYFPQSYPATQDSTSAEVLTQCGAGMAYVPVISIRAHNDKLRIDVWGQSNKDTDVHENEVQYYFADIERGKWHHIKLFVKEGYMQGHCPIVILEYDGEIVFVYKKPNTANTVFGGQLKYGIYKAAWGGTVQYSEDSGTRIIYFDNIKLTV